eukprot:scaffold127242_cov25-Tisochrysis_lutea.AAC.4
MNLPLLRRVLPQPRPPLVSFCTHLARTHSPRLVARIGSVQLARLRPPPLTLQQFPRPRSPPLCLCWPRPLPCASRESQRVRSSICARNGGGSRRCRSCCRRLPPRPSWRRRERERRRRRERGRARGPPLSSSLGRLSSSRVRARVGGEAARWQAVGCLGVCRRVRTRDGRRTARGDRHPVCHERE